MKRKTVKVEEFRNTVNEILRTMHGHTEEKRAYRKGMMTLLEDILHDTGNYNGFQYLGQEHVPHGDLPGINWGHVGDYEASFFNTDNTRVVYF